MQRSSTAVAAPGKDLAREREGGVDDRCQSGRDQSLRSSALSACAAEQAALQCTASRTLSHSLSGKGKREGVDERIESDRETYFPRVCLGLPFSFSRSVVQQQKRCNGVEADECGRRDGAAQLGKGVRDSRTSLALRCSLTLLRLRVLSLCLGRTSSLARSLSPPSLFLPSLSPSRACIPPPSLCAFSLHPSLSPSLSLSHFWFFPSLSRSFTHALAPLAS